MKRIFWVVIPLGLVLCLPLLLRKPAEQIDLSADQLVIVSPHNESIRFEFEQAFRRYYYEQTGRKVSLDWRTVGGASDIVRYLASAYTANFRDYWINQRGGQWSEELALAFLNRKLGPDSPHWEARQEFLQSDIGIGIDLFFGGGQYDFQQQTDAGVLVPCGLRERHPEWFAGPEPIILAGGGGEVWYDSKDRYYGVCFSSFGICGNVVRLQQAGYTVTDGELPLRSWADLSDPRLFNAVGLADPSKSGSITKCFEMLIQRQMQDSMSALQSQVAAGSLSTEQALDRSWRDAINLIKRIGGNASYLTFSASKVPMDTAMGQIAAGMCIDFYGRSQAEWVNGHQGETVMLFRTPDAASTVSADPVGMLRGAPHPERARMFIDFLLSQEGQRLWGYRAGTPGGPEKYSLHRLPVRRDVYTPQDRSCMSAPEAEPFALAAAFQYQGSWTGPLFDVMRILIKVMVIDCEPELRGAWKAILDGGGPAAQAEAMAAFEALPFEHSQSAQVAAALRDSEGRTKTIREWLLFFRHQFQQTRLLATPLRR
jgi:iron(III) transport system substrate-binding protein